MNIVTGYIMPTSGTVKIKGKRLEGDTHDYKKMIGYLPEIPPLYLDMTVSEYLDFVYRIKEVSIPRRKELADVMELTQISRVKGRLIKNLSKGYKQRVGMAQAIIGRPPLIILDEPTIGLDPTQTVEIRTLLNELKKSHTILFSSHILSEVNEVCDRVLMINEGKLIADSTSEELAGRVTKGRKKCRITASGSNELVLGTINQIDGVLSSSALGADSYEVEYRKEIRDQLVLALVSKDCSVFSISEVKVTLEDVFIHLTANKNGEVKA
jgi:ABC-2 type transport system ATP-binding protein